MDPVAWIRLPTVSSPAYKFRVTSGRPRYGTKYKADRAKLFQAELRPAIVGNKVVKPRFIRRLVREKFRR
jgi:hypothetical protein